MAFIPVPNVAQVNLIFTLDSQRCMNTLYFEFPTEPDTSEMETLAGEVFDWWDTNIKNLQSQSVALQEIQVTDLTFQDAPGIIYTTGLPVTGGVSASPALPNNVTISVTFLTLLRGRNNRGRNYFIGLTEQDVTLSRVGGAKVASIVAAYEELMEITVISFGQWVVVSRYLNNAPRVSGVANDVTGVKADDVVDSQRRRLPNRGM